MAELAARLDDTAAQAGRDPATLRRILNLGGTISDGASGGAPNGPVGQWVDEPTDLAVTYGFDTFILWAEGEDQLARFAEQVVPAVRAQVGADRT